MVTVLAVPFAAFGLVCCHVIFELVDGVVVVVAVVIVVCTQFPFVLLVAIA